MVRSEALTREVDTHNGAVESHQRMLSSKDTDLNTDNKQNSEVNALAETLRRQLDDFSGNNKDLSKEKKAAEDTTETLRGQLEALKRKNNASTTAKTELEAAKTAAEGTLDSHMPGWQYGEELQEQEKAEWGQQKQELESANESLQAEKNKAEDNLSAAIMEWAPLNQELSRLRATKDELTTFRQTKANWEHKQLSLNILTEEKEEWIREKAILEQRKTTAVDKLEKERQALAPLQRELDELREKRDEWSQTQESHTKIGQEKVEWEKVEWEKVEWEKVKAQLEAARKKAVDDQEYEAKIKGYQEEDAEFGNLQSELNDLRAEHDLCSTKVDSETHQKLQDE
jgi:chromosome segregation ATPase